MNKLKILCTGSCGFILGNFVRKAIYLSQKSQQDYPFTIVSIDKISNHDMNSYYSNKNHILHIADLTDSHIVDTIFKFEQPDIVVHGAASTHVDESIKNPNVFIKDNVLATQNLLNSSVKYNVKKFVYTSTDEVYGQLTSESDQSWTESSPTNPRNTYSASKLSGELLVKAMYEVHKLPYNITRSSNNYGPRQTADKFIPKIIKCLINNEKIPIYGKGLQIRDWTHVYDNCDALIKIIKEGKDNEVYNISANQEFSNIEVVQKICNLMGKSLDSVEFVEDRKGHDFRYSVNCDKLKSLGWKSQIKFVNGIQDTIDFYLNNKWILK